MRIAIVSVVSTIVLASMPAAAEPPKAPTDDVAVKAALERQGVVDLTRAGELSPSTSVVPMSAVPAASQAVVSAPDSPTRRVETGARASHGAGASRRVPLAIVPVERPLAGPRVVQRMDASRVLSSLEPTMRACAQRGVSQVTTLLVRLSVRPTGEVERADVLDRAGLRDEVITCVVGTANGAKFRAPAGAGASMVVPIQLPARTAVVPTTAPATIVMATIAPAAVASPAVAPPPVAPAAPPAAPPAPAEPAPPPPQATAP